MSIVLKIENTSVGYSNPLIKNINLSLETGNLYCIAGVNGSGKSTLLKSILQDVPIINGSVKLFGSPIQAMSAKELSKNISIVYTSRIPTNLIVNELLELGRQPYTGFLGKLKSNDIQKINKVIKQTNIDQLLCKKVDKLSDGQYQKVMLARALVQDTPLLLLDEPTSYLDPSNKVQLLKLLKSIVKKHNKAILFSSHDIELGKQFADVFLVVHNSKIEQLETGTPELDSLLHECFYTNI